MKITKTKMKLLKTIDNNSCQDRKLDSVTLQTAQEYYLDCYAATVINTTSNKTLSIYTEHDEHIITLNPLQHFDLVKESVCKTFGRIKVVIADYTEPTTPETTMKTHSQEWITGGAETEKVFNLTSIFDANKAYSSVVWKKIGDDWFIVSSGSITAVVEGGGELIKNVNSVLTKENNRTFTFSNLEVSTQYRYVIQQFDNNKTTEM